MWASNGRRAELVIESRDGSAVSEDIKSFLAAASVPLFLQHEIQPSLNEFPGKNCRRDLLSLFIYHEIYFRLCGWSFSGRSDMKCFFFWLITFKSCSASVTNSNAWDDEILINADESTRWDYCLLALLHLGWFVSAPCRPAEWGCVRVTATIWCFLSLNEWIVNLVDMKTVFKVLSSAGYWYCELLLF